MRLENLWTLGGLSAWDLCRRTAREAWQDDVFGQGGRMAFYQFLALFPVLVVVMALQRRTPGLEHHTAHALRDLMAQLFPQDLRELFQVTTTNFHHHLPLGAPLLSVLAGAVWASHNGTWALIYGLNRAYEVEESRSWQRLTLTIVALTAELAVIFCIALVLMALSSALAGRVSHGAVAFRILQWAVLVAALLLTFAVLYRFAPDLREHRWSWSLPGATFATLLWIITTFGIRAWFDHFNDYARSYGALNSVVMLLLWLYCCNGALLIGGEMNSEIVKALHKTTEPFGQKAQHSAD